jgi:hypothetical protein
MFVLCVQSALRASKIGLIRGQISKRYARPKPV